MSANPKKTIPPEVADILKQCRCDGVFCYLPPGQLAPALYKACDKHLQDLGGRWSKTKKAHVFPGGFAAADLLAKALGDGHTINEKVLHQAFYTPPDIAAQMCRKAHVRPWSRFLEPSAGAGNILRAAISECGAEPALCWAVEIDAKVIGQLPEGVPVLNRDFLDVRAFPHGFDAVVMNPPFTKDQDCKHVRHAFEFLRPGGRLVSVMLGNTSRSAFHTLTKELWGAGAETRTENLPPESFKESGTKVPTILLTVELPK